MSFNKNTMTLTAAAIFATAGLTGALKAKAEGVETGGRTCTQSIAGLPVKMACENISSAVEAIRNSPVKYDATVSAKPINEGKEYTIIRDTDNVPVILISSTKGAKPK